ncbi:MAG: molybdenum cofactor guanylyltransferase [Aquificaceae bacterium]|nr:molybdenum cofactor guanylyltransferase [Aquificaceae bacterium]
MIEGFVLAGGQSRRFGEDKLLYVLGKKRLIEYPVDVLKSFCHRVCVVAKDMEKFAFLDNVELLQDILDKQSALSGLYTAIKNAKGERCLVVAGDMPFLEKNLLKRLVESSEKKLTLFRMGGRLQPMPGVYYKDLLTELEEYLKVSDERFVNFVESMRGKELTEELAREVDPELLSFFNVNTKEDVEFILKNYGGKVF